MRVLLARKSRRVNDSVDGYEPGGRRFESCRARHSNQVGMATPCSPSYTSRLTPLVGNVVES